MTRTRRARVVDTVVVAHVCIDATRASATAEDDGSRHGISTVREPPKMSCDSELDHLYSP